MSHAPPTPPPTTAAELQDEQRDNAPSTSAAATADPPQAQDPASQSHGDADGAASTGPDVPQLVFPEIVDMASQRQWDELIQLAEDADVRINAQQSASSRMLITAPLVLAYMIQDNLPPANHALLRAVSASDLLGSELLALLKATSERDYQQVYSRSESLFNQTGSATLEQEPLAALVADLVNAFVESFRSRVFALVSRAFSSLPLGLAQTYVGMPAEALLPAAEAHGWSYDASTRILMPKPPAPNRVPEKTISGLETFNFVADSVSKLET